MLRTALLASAFAVCAAAPAFAAPAAHDWTGIYAGVNAGYGGDKFSYPVNGTYTDTVVDADSDSTTHFSGKVDQTSSGFLGGGQIGYDYQFGDWVLGAVADIDASGVKGEATASGLASGVGSASGHIGSKIDYLGTGRVRVGYPIADGRFMPFLTAGVAVGQVTTSGGLSYTPTGGSATSLSDSRHDTRTGWTVGGGADYAVTDHVRFGVEYLYTDLGTNTLLQGSFGTGAISNVLTDGDGVIAGRIGIKTTVNVMRATLNYQF